MSIIEKVHLSMNRDALYQKGGATFPLRLRVTPMDIRVGDVVGPQQVTIDWGFEQKLLVDGIHREVGSTGLLTPSTPAVVAYLMGMIRTHYQPIVDLRCMFERCDTTFVRHTIKREFFKEILADVPPQPLSYYLRRRNGNVPAFVGAILFQIALQAMEIPSMICHGWTRNTKRTDGRLMFENVPESVRLFHSWNMLKLGDEWIPADVAADPVGIGAANIGEMDESGFTMEPTSVLGIEGLAPGLTLDLSDLQMGAGVTEINGQAVVTVTGSASERCFLPPWLDLCLESAPKITGIEVTNQT